MHEPVKRNIFKHQTLKDKVGRLSDAP